MTASSQKETKCIFRIEEDLLKKYKSICEKNGYDMSKRLRLFVENEVKINNNHKLIEKELINCMQSNLFEFYNEENIKKYFSDVLDKYISKGDIYRYDMNIQEVEHRFTISLIIESLMSKPYILTLSVIKTGTIISGGF